MSSSQCSILSRVCASIATVLAAALVFLGPWPADAAVRLPPPTPGHTANATPLDGQVLVRLPGFTEFTPLTSARRIPLGSRLDTRQGEVQLTTALRRGGTAVTVASNAVFTLRQSAARASTVLALRSRPCEETRASGVRRPPPPDRLYVSVRASSRHKVRVAGRYSIAASKGTEWTTVNGCARTVTRVRTGIVTVRDLVAHRTVTVVSAGTRPPPCPPSEKPCRRPAPTGKVSGEYSAGGGVARG